MVLSRGCPLFLSTPSARRATQAAEQWSRMLSISIHALREEGDPINDLKLVHTIHFYPRPPRGGRRTSTDDETFGYQISIHALREEGDPKDQAVRLLDGKFLSTPSARRATFSRECLPLIRWYFYPRPPRGGRLAGRVNNIFTFDISIHALREEGDLSPRLTTSNGLSFLSTPSARRATSCSRSSSSAPSDFYPRPPRGGRRPAPRQASNACNFYPRPPRGGRRGARQTFPA